jgi:hypothetical protein
MTVDFVHRLVERVRSEKPALRPVVGPWSPATPDPLRAIEVEREVEQPAARAVERDAAPSPAGSPAIAAAPTARTAPMARLESGEPAPAPVLVQPVAVVTERLRAEPTVALRARDAEPEPGVGAPPRAAAPRIDVASRATALASTVTHPGVATTTRPSVITTTPGNAPATGPRMTREHAAEAAPVIRVHIGRIDVRAAAPPPPVARRPADPLPSVALDRYLDERERRR